MRFYVSGLLACFLLLSASVSAAEIKGAVVDPSGAPISGAVISAINRVGVVAQATAAPDGKFHLNLSETNGATLRVSAPGFGTQTVPLTESTTVTLAIAPQVDAVSVVGSAIDAPASEQGGSISIIPREEIRSRNEPVASDLLRELPGVTLTQTGSTGGLMTLYIRGGYPTYNLVEIDGVPVNTFGGDFDFAHIPSEALDRIEVIRGPQSAIYGPYANSGVINFVTRDPDSGPTADVIAEGGSHSERRFGISGAGRFAGFGLAASASRMDTDGPVVNSDYHNEGLLLNITRRWNRQQLSLHGDFDSNWNGVPGPWGSDPKHTFTGIDTISRNANNFSDYGLHYEADFTSRIRQEVFGSFFLNNNGFTSPFGFSSNKDIRGQAEARTVASVSRNDTVAFGVSLGREEVRNTFITGADGEPFLLRRSDVGVYAENRYEWGGRLFLNIGVRGEFIHTPAIPADGFARPFFPDNHISRANPKVAVAYVWHSTRLHSSFGTGIRPPGGFDLAYTDNPALQPERTRSIDAGIQQNLLNGRLSLDATYFHDRFYDLIVVLGGSLSVLSRFESDNIANSRAQGAEFSARLRPTRWIFLTGSYTHLDTEILSLNGSANQAPPPFTVGQQLLRRPADFGTLTATFTRGRISANVDAYMRGSMLDVEPSFGATNGLFQNPGYVNLGINLNYALGHGVSIYGNLRNALNQHYEEVFGFPSPRLNFLAGMKWTLAKGQ
ncbi:MAG TPA: TonB-dependent receptor [Bryobacteraceae bacterium]|nr:TonB-dependent receptor [Bryobacteraceae bacterium]